MVVVVVVSEGRGVEEGGTVEETLVTGVVTEVLAGPAAVEVLPPTSSVRKRAAASRLPPSTATRTTRRRRAGLSDGVGPGRL